MKRPFCVMFRGLVYQGYVRKKYVKARDFLPLTRRQDLGPHNDHRVIIISKAKFSLVYTQEEFDNEYPTAS